MSVNDVLDAVRAMSAEERAKIRALLDALGTEPGTPAEEIKQQATDSEDNGSSRAVDPKNSEPTETQGHNRQSDSGMESLRAAARAGSAADFVSAMASVDWPSLPAPDFVAATRLALEAGAYASAREISALGVKSHPQHAEIKKFAYVLAPPRIVSTRQNPDPSIRSNRDWFKAHSGEYAGKWVGLRNGVLLGYDESLQNLVSRLGKSEDILFTRVY